MNKLLAYAFFTLGIGIVNIAIQLQALVEGTNLFEGELFPTFFMGFTLIVVGIYFVMFYRSYIGVK